MSYTLTFGMGEVAAAELIVVHNSLNIAVQWLLSKIYTYLTDNKQQVFSISQHGHHHRWGWAIVSARHELAWSESPINPPKCAMGTNSAISTSLSRPIDICSDE